MFVSENTYGENICFKLHETREDAVSSVLADIPSDYDDRFWASPDGREIEGPGSSNFTVNVYDSVEEAVKAQLGLDEEALPHVLHQLADAVERFFVKMEV